MYYYRRNWLGAYDTKTLWLRGHTQVAELMSSNDAWLTGECITRCCERVNQYQFKRGVSIYCVNSINTESLLASRRDRGRFARILFNMVLGNANRPHFPKALVFCMHADRSHFITLVLIAALQQMNVYDSLITSSNTLAMIQEFAAALYLKAEAVIPRWMSPQTESPARHCAIHQMGCAIGAVHGILPHVSDSERVASPCQCKVV